MNAPPPPNSLNQPMPPTHESEAAIEQDAEHGRRAVARHYPDDTETGMATWKQLGIEKK